MRRAAAPSRSIILVAVLSVALLAGCGGQWAHYTTDEGLPDDEVRSVVVAGDGTVWAGTRKSLARFDGSEWTTSTPPAPGATAEATVGGVAAADDGAVWVGTLDRGIARFDGTEWTTYTDDEGLPSNQVHSVAVADDGTVWANARGGVARFDSAEWATFEGSGSERGGPVAVTDEGTVWVSTDSGVARFGDGEWATYPHRAAIRGRGLTSLAVANDGVVWGATQGHGLWRLDIAE